MSLESRAEIVKLARILGRDPTQLEYLEAVPSGDLRALRERTTEELWSANAATLGRLAAASKLLPSSLTATIGERAFGPLLSARLAGLLEPKRAAEVATRLPTPFLAEVAIELDPRRASALIALMPAAQIAAITTQLVARAEYVTMGRFVGHLSDEALAAALEQIDDQSLLRIGFVLEDKRGLERLLRLLGPNRIDGIIDAAAAGGLWLEAIDLLSHLGVRRRAKIVAGATELDRAAIDELVATVTAHDLWDKIGEIAARVPELQRLFCRYRARALNEAGPGDQP